MADHVQISFKNITEQQAEILIALLSEAGYSGFEETLQKLDAYIEEANFDKIVADEIADKNGVKYSTTIVKQQNWNEVWEANFDPVIIDDFVAVRAHFHKPIPNVEHEIVITPKMSFGTGHHATTYMMMQQMRAINFINKKVFDFGTGTGVLAILAEKLGAANITAIDIDNWSIKNAKENIQQNKCKKIKLFKADSAQVNETFDIILANINKNVILNNFSVLVKELNRGGSLLLSGLLAEDEPDILEKLSFFSFKHVLTKQRAQWIFLLLVA